jgi:hypothetical protein
MSFYFCRKKNFHFYIFLYLIIISFINLKCYKEEIIAFYKNKLTQIITKIFKKNLKFKI